MTCHTVGPALCPTLWPPVPQGCAFVMHLGRPCGGDSNPTTCSFSTCTAGCFAWLLTTEDPTTAGEDGVADEMWVRPVVMGSICSPRVGMNDMEWLLGGTWSIWPMLYEGDWVCMIGGVWLKSGPRSKDGGVNERWAGLKNVRGVCEGISGWEDAWAVGRGISRSGTAWPVRGGISGEGDVCGGGGNSGAGDVCEGGGNSDTPHQIHTSTIGSSQSNCYECLCHWGLSLGGFFPFPMNTYLKYPRKEKYIWSINK